MYKFFKRVFDFIISLIAIIILIIPMAIIALIIKITDPGPVFFKQKRVGIHKNYFGLLKFRTMKMCTPHDVPTHLLENPDQYITKIGKILRKTSLDELPQLFNIFLGQMSLIGPRPALWNQEDLIKERDKYKANDIVPGLSGWAQVNGRDELEIEVKAKFDGEYVERMSFFFDIKILIMTVLKVFKSEGVVEGGPKELNTNKKEKKVLFVATVDSHIMWFHLPYLKLFKDKGYEVHVATGENGEIPYCDVKHQISVQRSPFSFKNIKAIKELKKICNEEKFDIIHCHTPMGAVVTRLAAKKARKKFHTRVLYTAHGFHFFKGAPKKNWLLFYPVEKYLAKYTDTLITINKEDYELAKTKFSKRCHDIKYVPGVGIDTKKFDIKMTVKEKNDLRKSIGLKKDDFVLTCVARLDRNKNQGFLIKCMKELVNNHNDIHLLLAGGDELNGYYQNMVKEYNLEDYVHFLGHRSDIPQILKISDVVVSASKREGLPVNVMEAFASNIPVVALECRGMKDLITNGKNGYIINQDDSNEFIKKLINIKNKKIQTSNISIDKYTLQNIVDQMSRIYF